MWRFLHNRRLILRLYYFHGTHILGASRGGSCVSVASCYGYQSMHSLTVSLITCWFRKSFPPQMDVKGFAEQANYQ